MIYLIALNADDLLRDVDPATADRAGECSPNLWHFDPATGTLDFATRCARSRNSWEQRIQLIDFNYIVPEEEREFVTTWDQLKAEYPDILGSNILVHCNCPAHLYWGRKYIMTELDTALEPEPRFPGIRNPGLEGTVCKHLVSILRRYF